jgi:glutamyl-tRNA synthetase
MTVVTRFPPSPTGFLHIGGARTALFNWAFARANNGKMLMRIEDTDKERSTPEAVQAIIDGMEWLNINHDGEIIYQTHNEQRHIEVAQELLAKGKAYYCYCTPEELSEMREKGHGYDRRWRNNDATPPSDIKPVIRIKSPLDGHVTIQDKVQGDVTIPSKQLDDFIILRSDGTPTYMLAVVVDDYDMGITHVIRGDDHLTNTFRQQVIIRAMEWDLPIYAHMPMIHGDDGAKLSKRHGALSVVEYDTMGYLPDAMVNYLARLGWSHGDDEIFSRDDLIKWFSLDGINKSPARMDIKKLNDVNEHYIHHGDNQILSDIVIKRYGKSISDQTKQWLINGMDELKLRATTLNDLEHDAHIYIAPLSYDDKSMNTIVGNKETIQRIFDTLENLDVFDADTIQTAIQSLVNNDFDGKYGKVGMPFRAALTGRKSSPSVPNVAASLGKEETLNRLKQAIVL